MSIKSLTVMAVVMLVAGVMVFRGGTEDTQVAVEVASAPVEQVGVGTPGRDGPVSPVAGTVQAVADVANDVADGLSGGAVYEPDPLDKTAKGLGDALSPLTGGLSLLVSGLFVAFRRVARESKRRGRVILEADGSERSPPIVDQVRSGEAVSEVLRVKRGQGQ